MGFSKDLSAGRAEQAETLLPEQRRIVKRLGPSSHGSGLFLFNRLGGQKIMKKQSEELKQSAAEHESVSVQMLAASVKKGFAWLKETGVRPGWFPYCHQHIADAIFSAPPDADRLDSIPPDIAVELVKETSGVELAPFLTADLLQIAWRDHETQLALDHRDPGKIADILEQFERERPDNPQGQGFFAGLSPGDIQAAGYVMTYPPDLNYVFKGVLLEGTVGVLVAPGAAGKSTFALQLLKSVATGETIIPGFEPASAGKVLGVFCEEDGPLLHHRIFRIAKRFFPDSGEQYNFNPSQQAFKIASRMHVVSGKARDLRLIELDAKRNPVPTQEYYGLLKMAKQIDGLKLIVLDPVSRLYTGNENDSTMATLFISLIERLSMETGAAVLLLHHTSKGSSFDSRGGFDIARALHQDALRGSTGLTNGVRWQCNLQPLPGKFAKTELKLDRQPLDGVYLAGRICKQNYGPPSGRFYLKQCGGVLEHVENTKTPEEQRKEETLRAKILEVVREQDGELTPHTLIKTYHQEWKTSYDVSKPQLGSIVEGMIYGSELFLVSKRNENNRLYDYLTTDQEGGAGSIAGSVEQV